jgi:predicted transcriptional regulator YdeE
MEELKMEEILVIGIAVETSNENGKAALDIPKLWERFLSEHIGQQIPNKISEEIIAIYTHYESDFTGAYTTILGCQVQNLSQIPEGMVGHKIEKQTFTKFEVKGDLTQGIVYQMWVNIWEMDLNRAYTSDFEIYRQTAPNATEAQVDIFIAIK